MSELPYLSTFIYFMLNVLDWLEGGTLAQTEYLHCSYKIITIGKP